MSAQTHEKLPPIKPLTTPRQNHHRFLQDHTAAEQDWYMTLAADFVTTSSAIIAKGDMRKRAALQYILMATISAYEDGAGAEDTVLFLETMIESLRRG